MKALLKISIVALGFAGALLLAPSCRAQSEIAPDHFDGTDSWAAAAARKAPAAKTKQSSMTVTRQLATTRDLSKARPQLVAVEDKHKMAVRKSNKQ